MEAELTVQFIRNYTVEPLGHAVQEAAKQIGLTVKTQFGAYDNLGAEIATLASSQESPSIVIITIDLDYFSGGIFNTAPAMRSRIPLEPWVEVYSV